jgi:serine/threonine protein phosphatase PrpC
VLRVGEQYAGTDTGRQRRENEDSMLARAPLFVVADGMGGAQAGEVASRIAVEAFEPGVGDSREPEAALATLAQRANARIYELSHSHAEQAGMGTTLTAVYVGEREISIAHVGDSRAYRLREGRLTPEEAVEHPQRSVITRALGPEGVVEVDTRSYAARDGDVYLLCSDGLTTMLDEERVAQVLREHATLRDAGEALIAAANDAGGRDNITVVLLRVEELDTSSAPLTEEAPIAAPGADRGQGSHDGADPKRTTTAATATTTQPSSDREGGVSDARPVVRRRPRRAEPTRTPRRRRVRLRRAGALLAVLVVLGVIGGGVYVALQEVYFIGTNERGLVTMYRGVPFELPGGVALYTSDYVSGVGAPTLTAHQRKTLLDHSLRSEANAGSLVHNLELGQLE